jgi:VanZ family protein
MPDRRATLRSLILAAYLAMIVVGSLYPFWGWRAPAAWPADFLAAPLPRYITRNDVSTNLLAYLPLGYLLALALHRPRLRALAILSAWCLGSGLSVGLEALQQLLPGRIASNLDVILNSLGTLTGALLTLHHGRWLRAWTLLRRWRTSWFRPHGQATLGLWLLLLWGFTQFALLPQPGVGWLELHLRPIDTPPQDLQQVNLPWFLAVFLEMAVLGLYTACLLKPGRYASAVFLLFVSAFALKLLVAALLLRLKVMGGVLSLETLSAFVLALWLLLLPSVSRHRRAAAVVLLGLAAFGRLLFVPAPLWPAGSLLNLVGLARHLAALWPWLALAYLLWQFGRVQRRQ